MGAAGAGVLVSGEDAALTRQARLGAEAFALSAGAPSGGLYAGLVFACGHGAISLQGSDCTITRACLIGADVAMLHARGADVRLRSSTRALTEADVRRRRRLMPDSRMAFIQAERRDMEVFPPPAEVTP